MAVKYIGMKEQLLSLLTPDQLTQSRPIKVTGPFFYISTCKLYRAALDDFLEKFPGEWESPFLRKEVTFSGLI